MSVKSRPILLCTEAIALTVGFSCFALSPTDFAKGVRIGLSDAAKTWVGERSVRDVPVLVRLSTAIDGFSYDDLAVDGSDLAFGVETENGTLSVYPHEIETWDRTGTSLVWVKVPILAADATFGLYYGNGVRTAVAASDTWSNYAGVWHLDETGTDGGTADPVCVRNVSPNGALLDGEAFGGTTDVDGVFGRARRISDAVKDNKVGGIFMPGDLDCTKFGGTFTVSGWLRHKNQAYYYDHAFYKKSAATEANLGGYAMEMSNNSADTANLYGAGATKLAAKFGTFTDVWRHVALVFTGTTLTAYADGVKVASGTINAASDGTKRFAFGNDVDGYGGVAGDISWKGAMDELRLSGTAFDADYVAFEYAAMANEDLLAFGPVREMDATLPTFESMSARVLGAGTVDVTVVFGKNLPKEGSVFVRFGSTDYPLETTDTAVPATYRATVELTPDRTYGWAVGCASVADTVAVSESETPILTGALTVRRAADADEATLTPGAFVISRGDAGAALPIVYTVAGTARPGQVYEELSGLVVIPAGEKSVSVPVFPVACADVEEDRTVVLEVARQNNYLVTSASRDSLTVVNAGVVALTSAEQFVSGLSRGPNGAYELLCDIDLTGLGYTEVASFGGVLDGKGHTITGLGATSLFADCHGTVRNLTIDGTVGGANTEWNVKGAGGLFARESFGGTFENCTVRGYTLKQSTAKGECRLALLCGIAHDGSTFSGCETAADCIVDHNGKPNNFTAGLIGEVISSTGVGVVATIVGCTNRATLKATGDYGTNYAVGGIVANCQGASAQIPEIRVIGCVNEGEILVTGGNHVVGGLVGKVLGASDKARSLRLVMDRCVNKATFSTSLAGGSFGGLVGTVANASCATIRNSRNLGAVDAVAFANAGGLLGSGGVTMSTIDGGIVIENCANYGAVTGKDAGGIMGDFSTNVGWASGRLTIVNVASYGEVTGSVRAGGILPLLTCAGNGPLTLDNCLTAGGPYASATNLQPVESNLIDLSAEGYEASAALAALNAVASEMPAYLPWVMGEAHPELAIFTTGEARLVVYTDWNGAVIAKGEAPEAPTRAGYTFREWELVSDETSNCLVYESVYEPTVCTVSFDYADGRPTLRKPFAYDSAVVFPPAPEREGYVFCGWAANQVLERARNVNGDIAYTAIWKSLKQPAKTKLRVMHWVVMSGDSRHRAAIAASLKAQFDAEAPDLFVSSGNETTPAFTEALSAAIPGYTFVYCASNGSSDGGGRLFGWKTDRFEAGALQREMFVSNATTGWLPVREKGTENYYVLMSAFLGTTKNMTDYFNALPSFYAKIRAMHPTATFIQGANYENFAKAPSLSVYESTYGSDPAKVLADFTERTGFTALQAADDFQWLSCQSAYDPIDAIKGPVKRFSDETNTRSGSVLSIELGRASGFTVTIR